jgi:predicted NodU family carbamoyl transferase
MAAVLPAHHQAGVQLPSGVLGGAGVEGEVLLPQPAATGGSQNGGGFGHHVAMRILAFKPHHDGAVAFLDGPRLVTSVEPEKDSFPRFDHLTPSSLLEAGALVDVEPDVVALGGWHHFPLRTSGLGAPYEGVDPRTAVQMGERQFFGRKVRWFSSSHDRSHLLCAYGLSPFPQGQPCYALVCEGDTGGFYRIDEKVGIEELGTPLRNPGQRYVLPYQLADPTCREFLRTWDCAGTAMALAAFSSGGEPSTEEAALLRAFLDSRLDRIPAKARLSGHPLFNAGVESELCKRHARLVSDAIFDRFFTFAQANLREGLPLLITGGCALNCEWNTRWLRSGLFADVFIPPCPSDSGSAIGTAVDALLHFTGQAKIEWSPYAGAAFQHDVTSHGDWEPADPDQVADLLAEGAVIGWVQGRCEIGPRALGARSILAAPFDTGTRDRLNRIKRRQPFRPVAPVCLLEDVSRHFDWSGPSPYMLHFCAVRDLRLRAITHVDGSARVQTIDRAQNGPLAALLEAFRRRTGAGVLCNTSLNYPGRGFINRMSALAEFAANCDLDACVVDGRLFRSRASSRAVAAAQ